MTIRPKTNILEKLFYLQMVRLFFSNLMGNIKPVKMYMLLFIGVKDQYGKSVPSFEFQFTVTSLEEVLNPKDCYETNSDIRKLQDSIAQSLQNAKSLQKTKSIQSTAADELPSNFPKFTVKKEGTPAKGYVFLSPSHFVDLKGFNLMVDDTGGIYYWEEITNGTPVDFKVLPNGYLSYGSMYEFYDFTGGGPSRFYMMDSTFTIVDSFQMGNGYVAESHEFQLLPNGHALMLSYDLQPVDMAKLFLADIRGIGCRFHYSGTGYR